MEYNQELISALQGLSISPLLIGDPDSLRGLLEDKLDEANSNILYIDIDVHTIQEDIVLTKGEIGYLAKVQKAYDIFMDSYKEYLDNKSIVNSH